MLAYNELKAKKRLSALLSFPHPILVVTSVQTIRTEFIGIYSWIVCNILTCNGVVRFSLSIFSLDTISLQVGHALSGADLTSDIQ